LKLASTGEVNAAHQIDCSANDIVSLDGRSIVTLDHGSCGWRAAVEDVFGLKKARVVDEKGEMVTANLGFANGLAAPAGDRIFVAATRERALYPIDFVEGRATIDKAIPIGAAPDNLTLSDDGAIVAAVHPSLLAIGLQRRLGVGRSPSRIVEIDPANGDQMRLFDDPKGSVIAAATAAISTRGLLIIGSVMDPGIVVCRSAM
jgi:sugar lactone lactonase YvrE